MLRFFWFSCVRSPFIIFFFRSVPAQLEDGCAARTSVHAPRPCEGGRVDYRLFNSVSPLNTCLHTADTVSFPVLPPPDDVDHVFSSLGALLSSRRFPGSSILSCCSYSVVGAYRLIETGEGPLDSLGVPRLCVPSSEPGITARQGVTRWQFDLRGMRSGLCADPFPIRMLQMS